MNKEYKTRAEQARILDIALHYVNSVPYAVTARRFYTTGFVWPPQHSIATAKATSGYALQMSGVLRSQV